MVNDDSIELQTSAVVEHGGPAFMSELSGSLKLKAPGIPDDLRNFDLSHSLVHHWLHGDEVKLDYYMTRLNSTPFAEIELVVEARNVPDQADLIGKYSVNLHMMDQPWDKDGGKNIDLTGKITCLAE